MPEFFLSISVALIREFTETFLRSGEILQGGLHEPVCRLGFVAVVRLYTNIVHIHACEFELSGSMALLGSLSEPFCRICFLTNMDRVHEHECEFKLSGSVT